MVVLCLVPSSELTKNVHRDVLYGCWCKGKRIGGGTLPPLVLLSVATVLYNDGHKVVLADMKEGGIDIAELRSIVGDYDVVVMLTSTMSFTEDAALLLELKKENPGLRTVIFGAHPTFMPESSLKHPGVDLIVRKEPEFVIRDLLFLMEDNDNSWKAIPGIGYLEDGQVKLNPLYSFVDLNELPIPDRSLLPQGSVYRNPIIKYYPYTTTVTSQGCPAQCTFCTAPGMTGDKLRYWKADKVLDEIGYLLKMGYREIYYRDEIFTVYKRRNMEVYRGIREAGYKFSWICNAKVGNIDKEQLEAMAEAGCRVLKVGVESGSQQILDSVKKGVTLEQIRNLFQWTKEVGIDTHGHFMLGMPGETKDTIERTIDFMLELEPTTVDIGVCTAYPGTTLWEQLAAHHDDLQDGLFMDLSNIHLDARFNHFYTELPREYIEESINRAYRKFYLRPGYVFSWLNRIESFSDLRNAVSSGFNVARFSILGE